MKMFECCREIEILHGAFISALRSVSRQSEDTALNLCGLSGSELDLVISIINETMKFIRCGYGRTVKNWSKANEKLAVQRMHTALFYKVLSSSGITCNAAEEYYQSISNRLVNFDWKFYMRLITDSFGDHFAQCLVQLPDDIASMLLQWTINELNGKWNSYYLYSTLQILVCKLLRLSHNFSSSDVISRFDFPFKFNTCAPVSSIYKNDENGEPIEVPNSESEVSINGISSQMLHFLKSELNNTSFTPVLLQWVAFVLDRWLLSDVSAEFLVNLVHVEPYFHFIRSHAQSETVIGYIKNVLYSFSYEHFKLYVDSGASSSICVSYVLYLLRVKWVEFEKKCQKNYNEKILQCSMKMLKEIIDSLYVFHPLSSVSSSSNLEPHIKMLIHLIDHKLDGVVYAWEMLLTSDVLILNDEVLSGIERNLQYCISDMVRMKYFMDVGVKIPGPEKTKVVQVFLKAYSSMSLSDQLYLLETFLNAYGLNTSLELPSFENELAVFNKRTRNVEEVICSIAPLCIQSAEKTISGIIGYIVEYVPLMLIQALKTVRCVCCYSGGDGSPPLLIRLLRPYFMREKLDAKTKPHILLLTQELVKAFHDDEDAFPIGKFLRLCVLPNFSSQPTNMELKFFLEVLHVILEHSINNSHFTWIKDINVTAFVAWLCYLINFCIINHNGCIKDMAVCSLVYFSNLIKLCPVEWNLEVNQKWLQHFVSDMHPCVEFYVWDYIHDKKCELPSLDLHCFICCWIICHNTSTLPLEHSEIKNNVSLVVALAQNLPHFTKDEFHHLYDLFGCIDIKIFPGNTTGLLTDINNTELINKKLQAIHLVEVLVDAFLLLKNHQSNIPYDWLHMLTNFASTVKVCLSEVKTCPLTLTKVFLEVCRMVESFNEGTHVLGATLHDIQKLIKDSVADSETVNSCKKYLLAAVQNLHTCDVKHQLVQFM